MNVFCVCVSCLVFIYYCCHHLLYLFQFIFARCSPLCIAATLNAGVEVEGSGSIDVDGQATASSYVLVSGSGKVNVNGKLTSKRAMEVQGGATLDLKANGEVVSESFVCGPAGGAATAGAKGTVMIGSGARLAVQSQVVFDASACAVSTDANGKITLLGEGKEDDQSQQSVQESSRSECKQGTYAIAQV